MTEVTFRTATTDDLPVLRRVSDAYDTHWFGAPEHDEAELRELFDVTDSVLLVTLGEHVIGYVDVYPPGAEVTVDPAADAATVYPAVLRRLVDERRPEIVGYAGDTGFVDAVSAAGWAYSHSSYQFEGDVADVRLDAPAWPDGVDVRDMADTAAEAVHEMIYDHAGWAEVRGHHARTLEQWRTTFIDPLPEPPLVAWRRDRPVGVVVTRRHSTGAGWISQLAVARYERGTGLGRALLLAGLGRLAARDDVSSLGLEVMASNEKALNLYSSVGLRAAREYRAFRTTT